MSSDCDYHSSSFMLLTPQSDCEFDLLLANSIQSGALQQPTTNDSKQLPRITPPANSLIGSIGLVNGSINGSVSLVGNNRSVGSLTNSHLLAGSTNASIASINVSSSSSSSTSSPGASDQLTNGSNGRLSSLSSGIKLEKVDTFFSSASSSTRSLNSFNNSSNQSSQSTGDSDRAINDAIKGNEVHKAPELTDRTVNKPSNGTTTNEPTNEITNGTLNERTNELAGLLPASVSNQLEPIYLLSELGSRNYELINVSRSTGFADANTGGRLSISAPTGGGVPPTSSSATASHTNAIHTAASHTTANQRTYSANADQLAFFKTITNEPDAAKCKGRSWLLNQSHCLLTFFWQNESRSHPFFHQWYSIIELFNGIQFWWATNYLTSCIIWLLSIWDFLSETLKSMHFNALHWNSVTELILRLNANAYAISKLKVV